MSDAAPALLDAEERPVIEDHVEATTDAAPSPATTTTTTTNDVHVHVPYQIDLMTPRQSISLSANGSPAVKAAAKARNGSSTSSPTPKVQGRPSQAPQLAARVARGKDASHRRRSISAGPLHRPQRRVPSNTPPTAEAAKTEDEHNATAAAANVLPTSTRRLGPSGEVIKAPATAATTTTTVTRTNNNNILVRRPRFVDPMAGKSTTVAAPSVTAAAAMVEPAPAAQPSAPVPRRTARPVAPIATGPLNGNTTTAAASHAALYTHSIPYHNPTRTPQRVPVAADGTATAADAHHRRRLLTSAHATGLVSRAPAASLESTATSTEATAAAAAAAAVTTSNSDAPPQHAAADTQSNQPTSPAASEKSSTPPVSTRTESEAAVDVHETNTDEEPPTHVSEEKQTVADASAPASTTATGAKPTAHSAHPVKVLPATVAAHGEKRVILSRPTSNPYTMRMSELKRPSESYKVSLNPSLQGSALARRSRQPRKVLNVFLTKYPVIRKLADELGWSMETSEEELNEYKFNLCWSDTVLSLMRLVRLSNWQRTNHFPSMYLLCRKGHLGTTLGRLRHRLPSHFAFYPRTWSMRSERVQFTQYMAAVRQRRILKYFIMKPNSGCQGRGIIVARDPLTALDEHALDNYIVQEYVHRPLLLEGKKFDLRVYVLLTSIRNPSVFLFNDGLVRICTEAYEAPTEENVKNPCKHLTNYAVNKKSADYVFNTDVAHMDVGNKRNFAFLNRWLEESGYSSAELWRQVGIIIVKTILAAQPSIARVYDSCFPTGFNDGYCCFEVLGFDILIDQKMRPWLMEVNHTPSFATETPLDKEIKSKLLTEVWSIIDCKPTDYEKDRQREREEFTKRNMPPWSSNHPVYGSQLRQGNTKQEAATTTTAAADDAETAANGGASSPAGSQGDVAADVPPYVHARRAHEDSKLQNFTRIYPSEEPEVQLVYDTIQNLALAESANNRLYYNSTVAVPITPPLPTSSPTSTSTGAAAFGMQSNNPLPLRLRPPSLGPVLTTTRVHSSNPSSSSSPNTTMPQRNLATSPSSAAAAAAAAASASVQTPTATMAPPNGAPSTIPVSSVPSLAVIRDGHATTSTTPSGVSATSPHASSSVNSRGEPSSKTRLQRAGASSVHSTSRGSAVPSEAAAVPAPPLSSLSLATTTPTTSAGTTPKTADATSAQAARAFTPRASATPATTSRTTTAASTPSAAVAKSSSSTTAATSVTAVKPRVAEVHRRASSRPSTTASNAAVMTELAAAEPVSGNAAVSADEHKTATAPTTTAKSPSPAQSKATPTTADGPAIRIARPSGSRQKSPSLEGPATRGGSHVMEHHHQHQQQQQQSLSASTVKRPSLSMSGSGRDAFDVPSAVHPRQKSVDHEGRSMSTHPEPTEEEIARLVALQAQLDYEAAADPKPDDEDDDYNLTE